jgi:hypothetical protein
VCPALYAAETASLAVREFRFVVAFAVLADCSVRAEEIANTTLDTFFFVPYRPLKPEIFIAVKIIRNADGLIKVRLNFSLLFSACHNL